MFGSTEEGKKASANRTGTHPKKRTFQIGDTFVAQSANDGGGNGTPKTWKLAAQTNTRCQPPELGPESPLHQAVLGQPYREADVRTQVIVHIKPLT